MRYVMGALLALAIVLVQVSSVQQFRLLGVSPNLVLVVLVAWVVVRSFDDALPMVAICGLLTGLIDLQTPGLVMLALLIATAAAGALRELHIIHSETVLLLLCVLAGSILYEGTLFAATLVAGGVFDPVAGFGDAVLPAAVVNVIIALPIYLLMRLGRAQKPRGAYSW